MKQNKWTNRIFAFCLGLVVLFTIVPQKVRAQEPMSITIQHSVDEKGMQDVSFALYRVADVSEDGVIHLAGTFAEYQVELNHLDSTGWKNAALTLAGYAFGDKIEPLQELKTNANGEVVLDAGGAMDEAVYLVVGECYKHEGISYDIQPFLITMPVNTEDGNLQYKVNVSPKYEVLQGNATITVVKAWKDVSDEYKWAQLTVQLIDKESKEVFAETVLSKENNWRYTFQNLPRDRSWYVIEKSIGENYRVSVEQDGFVIILTNTHIELLPDSPTIPEHPGGSEYPDDPDIPAGPDDPNVPDDPSSPEKPSEPELPQTGMLWWPVPVLAAAGLVCLLIGLVRRQQYE